MGNRLRVNPKLHTKIIKIAGAMQMDLGEIVSIDEAVEEMIFCFNKMWGVKIK